MKITAAHRRKAMHYRLHGQTRQLVWWRLFVRLYGGRPKGMITRNARAAAARRQSRATNLRKWLSAKDDEPGPRLPYERPPEISWDHPRDD